MSSEKISYEQTSFLQSFLELWTSYLERTMGTTKAILDGSLMQIRDQLDRNRSFEEVSTMLDDFLRSPVFLEAMKHHIEALIQTKQKGLGNVNSDVGTQGISSNGRGDEILNHLNGTRLVLVERLDRIESRIEKIESHLTLSVNQEDGTKQE